MHYKRRNDKTTQPEKKEAVKVELVTKHLAGGKDTKCWAPTFLKKKSDVKVACGNETKVNMNSLNTPLFTQITTHQDLRPPDTSTLA